MSVRRAAWRRALASVGCIAALAALASCSTHATPPDANDELARAMRALWNFSDPVASERAFRERAASAVDPDKAELETQALRALALQGKTREALLALDALEPRTRALPARVGVRVTLERGRCLNSSGDPAGARPLFVAAWERARAAGLDDLAVDAAHMVAITEIGTAAVEWNLRALALADSSPSDQARRWRTALFNNLAWAHHDLGEYDRALTYFEKARDESRSGSDLETQRIAVWSVARALRSLHRHDEALAIQERLEAELAAADQVDGYVLEEIAENLEALGRYREAAPYFRRAHVELTKDETLARTEPDRLERLQRLGGESEARP